jgi:hypothetical protein
MEHPLFYVGQAIGAFVFFSILFGIFAAGRWAFRKIRPARPRKPSGPLSGAGKIPQ